MGGRLSSETSDSLADRGVRSHPRAAYEEAERRHGAEVEELERRVRIVEAGRLGSFLVGAVVGLLYTELPGPPGLALGFSIAALTLFAILVTRHRRLRSVLRRGRAARTLARLGLRRLERDWAGIAELLDEVGYDDALLSVTAGSEDHAYARDLDLFGPASVRALLGPTPTPTGLAALRRWLEGPAPLDEVVRRQAIVRVLAEDRAGRERLAVEALLVDRVDRLGWVAFTDWLGAPPAFASPGGSQDPSEERVPSPNRAVSTPGGGATLPPWSIPLAWIAPPVTVGLFAAWAAGAELSIWIWLAPLLVQGAISWRWGKRLDDYFDGATGRSRGVRRHHALFAAWEAYGTEEPEIRRVQGRLVSDDGVLASQEIRSLERWLDAADSRASMLHFIFAAAFFWDIHVAAGLERWRRRAASHVVDWFESVGDLEALSALATLAHDQPEWCFPKLDDGPPMLEAEDLGHPLLSDRVRRTSDVQLDPPGRFLLVTGSNMSGKSTLLRSIGLAAVLGQSGSVVCARRASLTPLQTFTSMRIHDSLTQGVSLFMAELLRLKALVDAADRASAGAGGSRTGAAEAGGPALLYLIDEVLQGTNSEERRIAARRIVRHLLESNAIGAVTTHDLSLHDDTTLGPASRKVHFRETVDEHGGAMLTFDYVLRPGLATSRNALKLLRMVGLGEE
jgi:energy-coupling factor transporter ATP-binding protein EcfA2